MGRATAHRQNESSGAARDLLLDVELQRGRMRKNLRETLRSAIQEGSLGAGTTLPSARDLAAALGLSRGVVTDVYDQLAAEGYLAMEPRHAATVAGVASAARAKPEPATPTWRFDFTATTPNVELFPFRQWIPPHGRSFRGASRDALDSCEHPGRIQLRVAGPD